MRRELTDVYLRNLPPPAPGKRHVYTDTRVPNLQLRMTSSGAAAWSVRARTLDGKRAGPKLGTWPALGIAAARKQAMATLTAIHGGQDPVAAKHAARAAREARTGLPTVAERLAAWQHAKAADWSPRYSKEVARIVAREITAALGKVPLAETTRAAWVDLVVRKRRTAPAMAALMYRVIAAFLNDAEARGWLAVPLLPRKGLATLAPVPAARERVLSDAELVAIWEASGALNPKPRCYVRLSILSGARQLEVADIAIGEIDRDAGLWTIPGTRTKNGKAITLPLCWLALVALADVWPKHATAPGWRMLGDIAGSGLSGFSKLKSRLDDLSGVTGWRYHDLRRTMRTGLSRLGVPPAHAEAAINHTAARSALERTYDRHSYAGEIIAAVQRWQAHVGGLVTLETPLADMLSLRRSA
jgi:integrase